MNVKLLTISFALLSVILGKQVAAQEDVIQQQMDRVNQILQQVQERTGANVPKINVQNEKEGQLSSNPFSREKASDQRTSDSQLQTPSQEKPKVEIGSSRINIDVNGKSFSIPRINGQGGQVFGGTLPNSVKDFGLNTEARTGLKSAFAYEKFANSLLKFKQQEFEKSEVFMTDAIHDLPSKTLALQHFSLVLFQNGKYDLASEAAYDSLAARDPFDWATIKAIYGNVQPYNESYKSLQKAAQANPDSTAIRFLLGYHHLMLGHHAHAVAELKFVSSKLENDPVVAKLLSLTQEKKSGPPMPNGN